MDAEDHLKSFLAGSSLLGRFCRNTTPLGAEVCCYIFGEGSKKGEICGQPATSDGIACGLHRREYLLETHVFDLSSQKTCAGYDFTTQQSLTPRRARLQEQASTAFQSRPVLPDFSSSAANSTHLIWKWVDKTPPPPNAVWEADRISVAKMSLFIPHSTTAERLDIADLTPHAKEYIETHPNITTLHISLENKVPLDLSTFVNIRHLFVSISPETKVVFNETCDATLPKVPILLPPNITHLHMSPFLLADVKDTPTSLHFVEALPVDPNDHNFTEGHPIFFRKLCVHVISSFPHVSSFVFLHIFDRIPMQAYPLQERIAVLHTHIISALRAFRTQTPFARLELGLSIRSYDEMQLLATVAHTLKVFSVSLERSPANRQDTLASLPLRRLTCASGTIPDLVEEGYMLFDSNTPWFGLLDEVHLYIHAYSLECDGIFMPHSRIKKITIDCAYWHLGVFRTVVALTRKFRGSLRCIVVKAHGFSSQNAHDFHPVEGFQCELKFLNIGGRSILVFTSTTGFPKTWSPRAFPMLREDDKTLLRTLMMGVSLLAKGTDYKIGLADVLEMSLENLEVKSPYSDVCVPKSVVVTCLDNGVIQRRTNMKRLDDFEKLEDTWFARLRDRLVDYTSKYGIF